MKGPGKFKDSQTLARPDELCHSRLWFKVFSLRLSFRITNAPSNKALNYTRMRAQTQPHTLTHTVCEAYKGDVLKDWWSEEGSSEALDPVRAPSSYLGPSIEQRQQWKKQGSKW